MAERLHDLTDLLRAAESERVRGLAATPTDAPLRHAHAALRRARTRRAVLGVGGAAAAVAVLVAGAVAWTPPAAVPPAGPVPTPAGTPSAGASVPGLPPLRQATEEEVRGAPDGSMLVMWSQSTWADVTPHLPIGDAHLLLLRPDGEVLQVAPAPQGAGLVLAWDRAAATAAILPLGESTGGVPVVDLLTGRVVGTADEQLTDDVVSPDGSQQAWRTDATLRVRTPDGVLVHDLPARGCRPVVWVDAAQLLLDCPALDPVTLDLTRQPGATTVLVDAATGAVTQHRHVPAGEDRPVELVVRTQDGRAVVALAPAGDVPRAEPCRTRLGTADGLDVAPLGEVPPARLHPGGATTAGDRLLVAGSTGCEEGARSGVWALDLVTGAVEVLLPPTVGSDAPIGLVDVTPGR
ncbi:hypothetical protein [Cellulomonas phragmiteti]|uniref:Lipoprotein LpqB beta-propeller domain-containing protein n=1 Tax=Cellulomonas phragmiteti TaxID=478780 RepID=A0ABQ4DNH2_9CELL|nr:hypothetical protein [Cellulomonas phragmiteti]GIG40901.1 hypothetical protein Cph01nite_26630 [Cellulomonas phragmiteti]